MSKGKEEPWKRWTASCGKKFDDYYEVIKHEKECELCLRRNV